MKLHLPVSLLKCLLSVLPMVTAVYTTLTPAEAGRLHADVTMQTYTDFGQNMGRYVVGRQVNALLNHIRTTEGGITIHYTDGTTPYTISNTQGMIDFRASGDDGAYVAVSPNATATVLHNGTINASFGERVVGAEYAINYSAIDVRYTTKFRLGAPGGDDYMLQRQSKIVTDAVWNPVAEVESETELDALIGQKLYHSGAGVMKMQGADGKVNNLTGAYQYIVGDISTIVGDVGYGKETLYNSENGNIFVAAYLTEFYYNTGATERTPLPNLLQGGDSGSPVYIYNAESGRYEYLAALQAGDDNTRNYMRGNPTWIAETLEGFNSTVDMSKFSVVYLNAIETPGASHSETVEGTTYSTTLYSGAAKAADGTTLATYNGIQSSKHTWKDLSGIKNEQNWYAYDSDAHLNQSVEDLFYTNNLVFNAAAEENEVILTATVDLGIGYTEFNGGKFTITSEGDGSYQLDSAGYVINEGAEVHLQLVNSEDRMTEWRKIGDGALYIDGTGDTNALLSVGGSGKTYLQQTGGYAAYNVLASSGATVSIKDTSQIERDFTFGVGGGTLDMNGNCMDWYTTAETSTDDTRFSINALTEEAMIHNSTGDAVLTYKEGKDTTYLGSFSDSSHGSLSIDYQGGGTWTLHSIHTDLSHNAGSGLTVSNGKVVLAGTLTRHGMGSVDGTNQERITRSNDWHYADAAMDVTVKNGATFELGSHARLQGDVTVEQGGTYIMREGVQQQYEYVEGGAILEDTAKYSSYYGHKGDVALAAGSNMKVEYSTGTSANINYAGSVSGDGSLTVAAGTSGGTLTLSGDNSAFTGAKIIESGGVIIAESSALGDTSTDDSQWQVGADGWIASQKHTAAELLEHISSSSEGTLALSCDTTEQLDFSEHRGMYLGAEKGKTVNYGEDGTIVTLEAIDGAWRLGGGGGTLVVNFKLSGANDLILGASESASGIVHLANTNNDFTGSVRFTGENVVLTYEDGALGDNNAIQLAYGNSVLLNDENELYFFTHDSAGMALVDAIPDADLYMNSHGSLSIGSSTDVTYIGEITVADNQAYRFGATSGATFTVDTMLQSGHDLVIDSQSTSGGTVMLAGNSIQTVANLSVSANSTFTLGQHVNAAGDLSLAAASALNLNGHKLSVQGDMNLLGQVQDTVGGGELAWNLTDGEHSLNASIDIENFRINGTGTLVLNDSNIQVDTYHVDGGTLRLGDNVSLNGSNTVCMSGGTLHTGSHEYVNFNIAVEAGGSAVIEHTGVAHNNGFYTAVDNYTGFRGNIVVGQGGELKLTGSGIYEFMDRTYGSSGGTINLACSDVYLYDAGDDGPDRGTIFKGTLRISENVNIHAQNWTDNLNHHIECLQIDTGKQLTLLDNGWNSVLNIGSLSGEGDLIWNSKGGHASCSYRMILSGKSDYSGRIELNRTAGLKYSGYIELASDEAAGNAVVCLNGQSSTKAILAVNSADAHIGGLEGNQDGFAYAGASVADTSSSAPATTRAASLTIETASGKEYTYAGTIGNSTDTATNGLTLVKTGSGLQTLSGSTYLSNLRVEGGTLSLPGTIKSVKGDIALANGATLDMGNLTLCAGQTFSVIDSATEGTATFAGKLTMSGGTLEFDCRALGTEDAALALTGGISISSTASKILNFTHINCLEIGKNYILSTGSWGALVSGLSASGLDYFVPTFSANSSGYLQMSVSMAGGYYEWANNEDVLQDDNKVVFFGSAGNDTISLTESRNVGTGIFGNNVDMTITSESGASLSFSDLQKYGMGGLNVEASVKVNNKLEVKENAEFSGSGQLSVNTLDVSADAQMTVTNLDVSVKDTITGSGGVHLGKESTLTFETTKSGYSGNNISGEGKVVLSLTDSWSNALKLGTLFAGETYVKSGYIDLTDATVGSTLRLADGVNANSYTGSSTVTADVILEGTSTVHANGSKPITYEGTVTGKNGVFDSNGGSSHTFKAEVNLAGFKTSHSETTNTFESKTTLGVATISQSVVNFNGETTIGTATVSGGTTNINGETTIGTVTVSGGTTNINGETTLNTLNQTSGTIYINDSVEVTGKVNGSAGTLALLSGELKLSGTGDNHVGSLDAGRGGSIVLSNGANLEVSGNMWMSNAMTIAVDSSLTKGKVKVVGTSSGSSVVKLSSSGVDFAGTNHKIVNSAVEVNSAEDYTLGAQLEASSVKNAGAALLTVNNSNNTLSGVVASGGDICLQNLEAAASLDLLEIAAGKTVGLYTGADTSSTQAAVTVSSGGSAIFGAGAVLNTACLTLGDGATLEMTGLENGSVTLSGALTFGSGLVMGESLLASVEALGYGEMLNLFTGLTEVTLPAVAATESDQVLASSVFSNVQSDTLYVDYQVIDNVGTLMVVNVPEPATTTLGLLALTALAARRRRKE